MHADKVVAGNSYHVVGRGMCCQDKAGAAGRTPPHKHTNAVCDLYSLVVALQHSLPLWPLWPLWPAAWPRESTLYNWQESNQTSPYLVPEGSSGHAA